MNPWERTQELIGNEALEKLKRLAEYRLHSIEQPIRAGQWQEMAKLCTETPLPIAPRGVAHNLCLSATLHLYVHLQIYSAKAY